MAFRECTIRLADRFHRHRWQKPLQKLFLRVDTRSKRCTNRAAWRGYGAGTSKRRIVVMCVLRRSSGGQKEVTLKDTRHWLHETKHQQRHERNCYAALPQLVPQVVEAVPTTMNLCV